MRYEEVKQSIKNELSSHPNGMTWKELKASLNLPYETLCPEWTKSLEKDIGLVRDRKGGRALTWFVEKRNK